MYHKLHDGPSDFVISGGKVRRPPAKPRASLAALQWAAEQKGLSYGVFTQRLTAEDGERIQKEYEAFIQARDEAVAAHCAARVENTLVTDEFIITDDDN